MTKEGPTVTPAKDMAKKVLDQVANGKQRRIMEEIISKLEENAKEESE